MLILAMLMIAGSESPGSLNTELGASNQVSCAVDQTNSRLCINIPLGAQDYMPLLSIIGQNQNIKNLEIDFDKDCTGNEVYILQQLADRLLLNDVESLRVKCPRTVFKRLYKSDAIKQKLTHLYCAYSPNKQLSMAKRHEKLALFPNLRELKVFDISKNPALPKTLHGILSIITNNCANDGNGSIRICGPAPEKSISIWKPFTIGESQDAGKRSTRMPDYKLTDGETSLHINSSCLVLNHDRLLKSIIRRYPSLTKINIINGTCHKEGIEYINTLAEEDFWDRITSVSLKCHDQSAFDALQSYEKIKNKVPVTH